MVVLHVSAILARLYHVHQTITQHVMDMQLCHHFLEARAFVALLLAWVRILLVLATCQAARQQILERSQMQLLQHVR